MNTRAEGIQLAAIPDKSARSIQSFVRANVAPGTTLISDGHPFCLGLAEYRHEPRTVRKMAGHAHLPWIHRVFSLMKRWGLGTYHGLRPTHVDTYLEEFVFRFNRQRHLHVSFERILGLVSQRQPMDYWDITGRENPRKGQPVARVSSRRRKTALGMRKDGIKRKRTVANEMPL